MGISESALNTDLNDKQVAQTCMSDLFHQYALTLKDVPVRNNAFGSISVYNDEGYFQQNEHEKYVVNSRKAKIGKNGAVTIHFGGDPSQENYLPIMPNWNYMLRIYLPDTPYFDGSWKALEAQAVK